MAKSVGKRSVKSRPAQRRREVSLFDFSEDIEDAQPFFDHDLPEPAATTRDLATVAITLPLVGVTTSLIGTL